MKIEVGAFVLCAGLAGTPQESPEDLTREAVDTVQVAEGLRATSAIPYNRGNRRHTLRFSITRTYDTVQLAEVALLDHPADVPTTGDVKITSEGGTPTVRFLHNATVHAFAAKQIGLSIIWTYTITGGAITTS